MKVVWLLFAFLAKDVSSLNPNFGTNNVIDIFGMTDNDVVNNTLTNEDDPPPHAEVARYVLSGVALSWNF